MSVILPSPGPVNNVLSSIWLGTIKKYNSRLLPGQVYTNIHIFITCLHTFFLTRVGRIALSITLMTSSWLSFFVSSLSNVLDCIPFICVENFNFDHMSEEKKIGSARFLLSKCPLKQTLSNRHIAKIPICHFCKRNFGIHFCFDYHMP